MKVTRRDPRKNPQAGDLLEVTAPRFTQHVEILERSKRGIRFRISSPGYGIIRTYGLRNWQRFTAEATVKQAGGAA